MAAAAAKVEKEAWHTHTQGYKRENAIYPGKEGEKEISLESLIDLDDIECEGGKEEERRKLLLLLLLFAFLMTGFFLLGLVENERMFAPVLTRNKKALLRAFLLCCWKKMAVRKYVHRRRRSWK